MPRLEENKDFYPYVSDPDKREYLGDVHHQREEIVGTLDDLLRRRADHPKLLAALKELREAVERLERDIDTT